MKGLEVVKLNESIKRRLEALEGEAESRKPALLTVTMSDGIEQQLSPVEAIERAWAGGPGSLVDVAANRPEYSALAETLTAVFGQ